LSTALFRAIGLPDRLADRHPPPCGTPGRAEAARLRRWMAQPPFDDEPWWERRLATDGLTGGALLALLAEPPAVLAGRLAARPSWLDELDAAYWRDTAPGADPGGTFGPFAEPLLTRARTRLAATLDSGALVDQLYAPLPRLVDRMVTRVLTLELNVARVLGALPGDSATARFDAFRAGLWQPQERRRLLGEYPVLGRLLATVTGNWVRASALFAQRLADDRELLATAFGADRVVHVAPALGDPHGGGHTVTVLTCENGTRIGYKPRSVAPDAHVRELVAWLAARGLGEPPRLPSCVDRGAYGWVEFVTPRPCADADELARFYRRHGVLLALLYVLRAGDIGAENLIASGDHPVLVDLEAVCQPELALTDDRASAAERAASAAAAASVLRTGLLPTRTWHTADGGAVDLSGLGGAGGQLSPIALPEPQGAGTDRMRLRLRHLPLTPAANLPVSEPLRVLDHVEDILAGFTEAYELCARHSAALLAVDGPLAAFAHDRVRVILRSTAEYALLRDTGHHPDVLRDGLDTERHFDRLWRAVSRRPGLAACVEAERADLWRQDIPAFTVRADGHTLLSGAGIEVAGPVRRTGMECVREVVAGLGPADLARQRWLVRTSLAAATMDLRELEFASYPLPAGRVPAGTDRLLACADAIGGHLAGIAHRAPDSVQWLGVVSERGSNWSIGPLGPDLCTGLAGMALFYGFLGSLTGDGAHTAVARAALATARSQVDRLAMARVGGAAGLGGIGYAFTQLGVLWEDESLLDHAVALGVLSGEWAVDDEQYDFTSGSAGSIAALLALHDVRPQDRLLDAVGACADRLMDGREPDGAHPPGGGPAGQTGAAWLPRVMRDGAVADRPLAGLSHGAAGIAWPLLAAAERCARPRYREAALAGIAHERSLFVHAADTWRDLRHAAGGAPFDLSAWCHGAAGIGMARVRGLPYLAGRDTVAEIEAAVRNTLRVGFGMNHSLCHGDVGNLDLLLLAGTALGRPSWVEEAHGLMGAVLDSIDERGWISGVPHGVESPGLLQGLAGTGYGLLRMAAPHRVPSVLTFQPPPTAPPAPG
jgi:type 2 lantibiotic biosynthesis protein LanM